MEKPWPKFKNTDQCHLLNEYLNRYSADEKSACEYLNDYIKNTKVFPKLLMYDTFLLLCKSKVGGIRAQDLDSFENLIQLRQS